MAGMKTIFSWHGGKDSCLACYKAMSFSRLLKIFYF